MSGNPGTSNTGTSAFASAFGQHTATSTSGTFSFGSPKPAPAPSLFGGGTSAFGGSAKGATPVTGASGTNVSGSTAPSTGSAFSSGVPLYLQPKASGPSSISPSVTTGTSKPANPVFSDKDPPNPWSLEESRAQEARKTAGASGQTSSGTPAQPPSLFGTPTTQQPKTGSIFGGTIGAFGTTTSLPATGSFGPARRQRSARSIRGAFGKPQSAAGTGTTTSDSASAFGLPMHAAGVGSTFSQSTGPMLDPGKLERINELLRKSLLGEELVNTQFHLFSARSSPAGQVMKPRVLCANNVLLATGSKYFLDLLSSDINPSDPSLIDLTGDNDIPSSALIEDYGYESDSDLEECDDPIPVVNPEAPKDQSVASSTSPSESSAETQPKDNDGLSQDFSANKDEARPVGSSETAMRLRSLGSRHVLVKDTAFQTWYTLLNYLYTGKFSFLPLSSRTLGRRLESSTSSLDEPKCSAKSMYRLACKVGLDQLRDEAFSYIRSNLTEYNILKELSCRFVVKHPKLLEMELDVLYSHIASPPVVANFATFAQRIADKELPHGADIILGIHARLLKERQSLTSKPGTPTPLPSFFGPPKPAELAVGASGAPGAGAKLETGPSRVDKPGARSGSLPSEGSESPPPQTSANMAMPTATSTKELDVGGKRKATEMPKDL